MDLNQQKLNRTEWDTTEIPISNDEKEILNLIIKGYDNVNIIYNKNTSMINYLKLDPNENIMNHLFTQYFEPLLQKLKKKYDVSFNTFQPIKFQRINSVEKLKLDNIKQTIEKCKCKIFEFDLLQVTEFMIKYFYKDKIEKFNKYYYTLHHLMKLKITNVNEQLKDFINNLLMDYSTEIIKETMFLQSSDLIEKNEELVHFKDYQLYEHQKQLFTICKNTKPKLILYIAPTGTG